MDESAHHPTASPAWLTQTYLRDYFRKGLKNERFEISEMKIEPATATGENYSSQMFRVSTVVQSDDDDDDKTKKDLNVIIKVVPPGSLGVQLKEMKFFKREHEMLVKILPSIDALLKKAFPDHKTLHPICFAGENNPEDVIVLQDLRETGFHLADRLQPLDVVRTRMVLSSLGKLHAASLVLIDGRPELTETFKEPSWNRKYSDIFEDRYAHAVRSYQKMVLTWKDGPEKKLCLEKLKTLENNFQGRCMDNYERDDDSVNVIIHGDCWINNIMFRHEGSALMEMKFVDYQMSCWNSPVLDLLYFIFTSTGNDVRFGNVDQQLKAYHDAFTETLNRLQFVPEKPFTFELLKKEYQKRLFFGLTTLLMIYPVTVCPPANAPNLEDMSDEAGADRLYFNETMKDVLIDACRFFDKYRVI